MTQLSITVKGLDELSQALKDVPEQLEATIGQAGQEIGRTVLEAEGLRRYPPLTYANQPPTPYYIRGSGTHYARGNDKRSERLGTQYYVETQGYVTTIGNRASYAKYVSGDEDQAQAMAAKGWRKLFEVAEEKMGEITRIYEGWVARALKALGL